MAYQESVEWLFEQVPMFQNLGAGAYKPGLETTLRLSEAMGNPHKKLKCIHIAGTNGKGSTAHTIAAILQSAGYRVGLYTSPHLADFRERIKVDGRMADKAFVETFIERFRNGDLKQMQPTFFELTTILAFCYFEHMGVDVAVIETGLGGRLDSTNIINPELCVITNISLDHTALLGNTEAEIATEKAGIIKKGIPVVIGKAGLDVRAVFAAKAQQENAPIYFAEDAPAFKEAIASEDAIRYIGTPWGEIKGELCGDCQSENAATIMTALGILCRKFPLIDASAIKRGFAEVCSITGLMGRWMQTEDRGIRTICDTGHNIGGWQYLGRASKKYRRATALSAWCWDLSTTRIFRQLWNKCRMTPDTTSHHRLYAAGARPNPPSNTPPLPVSADARSATWQKHTPPPRPKPWQATLSSSAEAPL